MSFIRPELVARFNPWREVAAAGLGAVFGLWVFSRGGLIFQPVGLAILAICVMWAIGAWQRKRFRREIAAPGVVEIVEGAVRYYGARALGGEVPLRELAEIRLLRLNGQQHWRLRTTGGEALLVPVEAAGAAALADAFAVLPGFDLGAAAAALDSPAAFTTVWRRPARAA